MSLPFICLQFQQGGTGHHSALGHGLNGKLICVGHNNGCSYIITVRFDAVKVKFHQQLTFFHSLAVLDLRVKALAVALDGIHADVHQQLGTGSGLHGDGVLGAEHGLDHAVGGSVQLTLLGHDSNTVAQDLLRENLVLDLAQVNGLALQRAADNSGSSCSGSCSGSSRSGLGGLALGGGFVLVQDEGQCEGDHNRDHQTDGSPQNVLGVIRVNEHGHTSIELRVYCKSSELFMMPTPLPRIPVI